MRLPSEIVVERFLPTFRTMLASELDERGMTQTEIARHLGVSQPAVSKYVGGKVEVDDAFLEDRRTAETVERIADSLAAGVMGEEETLAEVVALVRALEDRGPICEIHEDEMPALRGLGCDVCVRQDSDVLVENEVLHTVRRAVREFENVPGVVEHIPNVGTNVGNALPDADDVTDVAAVPGRVYAMRGRVHVPANPEFGASENVARAILAANAVDPDVRGALNLATSDELLGAARDHGEPVEFDPEYEGRSERLERLFEERGVPRVAYHRGGFGIEPVAYVYGETAVDAVGFVRELVG